MSVSAGMYWYVMFKLYLLIHNNINQHIKHKSSDEFNKIMCLCWCDQSVITSIHIHTHSSTFDECLCVYVDECIDESVSLCVDDVC